MDSNGTERPFLEAGPIRKTSPTRSLEDRLLYPDDDGLPMSDNTIQFRWIVLIKEGLEYLFRNDPNVFVAGNHLWYAQEGAPEVRTAPDVMVVFGRPKGDRGSYMQWREAGVAPQVVFEVRSPGNRDPEMDKKHDFYDRHGVEEYYFFDPDERTLQAWIRQDGRLREVPNLRGWISPRLGVRFEPGEGPEGLTLHHPDGERFKSPLEAQEAARDARERAHIERRLADAERLRAQAAEERAERLAARLRELGEAVD